MIRFQNGEDEGCPWLLAKNPNSGIPFTLDEKKSFRLVKKKERI
jgi:hypothetical protein